MAYEPTYHPAYPNGYENLPSRNTPVTGEILTSMDNALVNIEEHLKNEEGSQGKSAYEIAVANGFEGTEQEWLASLEGEDGKSAYQIAVDNGFDGTEEEWLESFKSAGTNRIVVETLPSVEEADANAIYMIYVESVAGADKYEEYMLLNGELRMIGDTSVDLSDYVKKENGKGLSSNDFTDEYAGKIDANADNVDTLEKAVKDLQAGGGVAAGTLKPWFYDTSGEEAVIGVYDGKPLYRKIFDMVVTCPAGTTVRYKLSDYIENYDRIVSYQGYSTSWSPLPFLYAGDFFETMSWERSLNVVPGTDEIRLTVGVSVTTVTDEPLHVMIEYTKTTDAEGSGEGLMPYGIFDGNLDNKLDKDGDASETSIEFEESTERTNIESGEKQKGIMGKIKKWFADLTAAAFAQMISSYSDLMANTVSGYLPDALAVKEGFEAVNNNLLIASYSGLELYKTINGNILYKSNFAMVNNMNGNETNVINTTTWSCAEINDSYPLILPCRTINDTNFTQICMGFWIVFSSELYFLPLTNTAVPTKIVGSNFVE